MLTKRASYLPALDGLRGLAILMVICHNGLTLDGPNLSSAERLVQYVLNEGWIGVLLFFVLSGFLITGILLDSVGRPRALPHFMARRALRIFPLYYGTLFVIFVLLPLMGAQPAAYKAESPYQIWLWTYLVNWSASMGIGTSALPHFWSLAVEEQFYLVWPLLIYTLRMPVRAALACLVVAAMSTGCRAWMLHAGYDSNVVYELTITRLDALALGGFAAACWRVPAWHQWARARAGQLALAMLGFLLASTALTHGFPRSSPRGMVWGYLALGVLFAYAVYACACRDSLPAGQPKAWWHQALTWPALQQVGKYSYGMYVFHKLLHDQLSPRILAMLGEAMPAMLKASMYIAILTALAYGAAWLSYNLYEVHFLRLKRFFT
jgi:peptidoglycan/LPS O-acetylase OafA/YrhL